MKEKKFYLKSEKRDSVTQTPKTPSKTKQKWLSAPEISALNFNEEKFELKTENTNFRKINSENIEKLNNLNTKKGNNLEDNDFSHRVIKKFLCNQNDVKEINLGNENSVYGINSYIKKKSIAEENRKDNLISKFKFKSFMFDYENELKYEEIEEKYFDGHFINLKKIGEGDYCTVYAVKKKELKSKITDCNSYCLNDRNISCVKKYKMRFNGENDREQKLKEIKIMYLLKNKKNILQIYKAWEEENTLHIETEYCSLGTLKDLINSVYWTEKSVFEYELIHKIIFEVGTGLYEMSKQGIIHMDIKPENILIRSNQNTTCNGKCKCTIPKNLDDYTFVIGDFNISKFQNDDLIDDGDKKYIAPEILLGISAINSDVFSLGLIYLELLTGIVLPSLGTAWLKLRKNNFKDLRLNELNKEIRIVLLKMLEKDHTKRMTAEEIVNLFENNSLT